MLFYRLPLCRPDRFFSWLEPKIRWVWSAGFLVTTLSLIIAAIVVLIDQRQVMVSSVPAAVGWNTLFVVWGMICLATCIHECGHGLTCKHFGGEVPDAGLLLMFFMPCFYCNVSDAWLIREKSRRLWITLAGAYADLCVWAFAVFVWRVTVPETLVHHVAFVLFSVCGTRSLLNLNPFLKLDGYYLLSDFLEIPNLRASANTYWMAHVRWLLWGAERPQPEPRGRILIIYGIFVWVTAIVFLDFLLFGMLDLFDGKSLWLGWLMVLLLMSYGTKRVFKGFFASEFAMMIRSRYRRTFIWCGLVLTIPMLLIFVPWNRTAKGQFVVRPATRVEVHSEVEGFLYKIHVEEGDVIVSGDVIAELKSPALESQIIRKKAEIQEVTATLARLRVGPRPQLVAEQREKARRAEVWLQHANDELARAKITLEQELLRLNLEIEQQKHEQSFVQASLVRSQKLYEQGAMAGEQYRAERMKAMVVDAKLQQAQSRYDSRKMQGVRAAEAELTRRQHELAAAKAEQALLEAGTRTEDIQAELAKLTRLEAELEFLKAEQTKLKIASPVSGVVATQHMQEKYGQLVLKGGLVCIVENIENARIEITVPEEDVAGLEVGQHVQMKARSLPFELVEARVEKIAPTIAAPEVIGQQPTPTTNTFTVYCGVDNPDGELKTGMTGFARISRDETALGSLLINKVLKYVRTEFWW
ncbi:efflux RND transporter periplasmic adaptor subunit [Thalassoroseus pseudoceratinae]|uniref:efflux RND transporter periplasmic adaptor subunit n=1 Tax=Thalassoroseus pseudoceratinae TaxID=2713176 RepID=UPI0014233C24|nr:efflux RND transporter periplasmic adaptor subunit [Thalassoroseus pseudoceratinae]